MRRVLVAVWSTAALVTASMPAAAHTAPGGTTGAAKGRPPAPGGTRPQASGITYLYAAAHQRATADGAYAELTVAQPRVAERDFHSLAEVAAQSGDGRQIVEVGWSVDPGVFGDGEPHLFVFHWVDERPSCYNGCGFVATNDEVTAGMTVPVGERVQFAIQHHQGNWWVGYDGTWFGYFPDSLWRGRYTRVGLAQWFGEVAASSRAPCTDMGTGRYASATGAAGAYGIGLFGGPAPAITVDATTPRYYSAEKAGAASMRFGGPGAC